MGLFSGTRAKNPEKCVGDILLDGEEVTCTYKVYRNFISLTNKRVIIVRKTLLAREYSIRSIPYHKIDNIVVEKNRKLFSISSFITIINNKERYTFRVGKGEGEMQLYDALVKYICESNDIGK